jgi:hypothetical protein
MEKIEKIVYSDNHKEKKKSFCGYNTHEFWDTIKVPNLRMHGMEKGAEIQTKSIENLLNETTAENFPNLGNDTDTHI